MSNGAAFVSAPLRQSGERLLVTRSLITSASKVTLALAILLSALCGMAHAQNATLIPAFKGGVRTDAVLHDPQAIIDISSHCYAIASTAKDSVKAATRCIGDRLKQIGAGRQAIAFADYAPVPAASEYFANYRNAAAVYAVMRWADGASGWCLIGKSGEAIGMWQPTGVERDPAFIAFAHTHPNAMLWMPTDRADAASMMEIDRRGDHLDVTGSQTHGFSPSIQRFIFPFTVKTCHACAVIGQAHIGFDFDNLGHYAGAHLVSISSTLANTQ
jgi:hypothetical protein